MSPATALSPNTSLQVTKEPCPVQASLWTIVVTPEGGGGVWTLYVKEYEDGSTAYTLTLPKNTDTVWKLILDENCNGYWPVWQAAKAQYEATASLPFKPPSGKSKYHLCHPGVMDKPYYKIVSVKAKGVEWEVSAHSPAGNTYALTLSLLGGDWFFRIYQEDWQKVLMPGAAPNLPWPSYVFESFAHHPDGPFHHAPKNEVTDDGWDLKVDLDWKEYDDCAVFHISGKAPAGGAHSAYFKYDKALGEATFNGLSKDPKATFWNPLSDNKSAEKMWDVSLKAVKALAPHIFDGPQKQKQEKEPTYTCYVAKSAETDEFATFKVHYTTITTGAEAYKVNYRFSKKDETVCFATGVLQPSDSGQWKPIATGLVKTLWETFRDSPSFWYTKAHDPKNFDPVTLKPGETLFFTVPKADSEDIDVLVPKGSKFTIL